MDGRRRPLPGGQPGGKQSGLPGDVLGVAGAQIAARLIEPLEAIFRDAERAETQQVAAASALAHFAQDDTLRLAKLLVKATPEQYAILFPLVVGTEDPATVAFLQEQIALQPSDDLSEADRVALGKQRAGAAITLLRRGEQQAVLDVRRLDDDPEALTQFVHRCQDRGVSAAMLLDTLDHVDRLWQPARDEERARLNHVLYGLLLALGDFRQADVPTERWQGATERLVRWYAEHPSSAVHGATGWLLRQWGFGEEVRRVDGTPTPGTEEEMFCAGVVCQGDRRRPS